MAVEEQGLADLLLGGERLCAARRGEQQAGEAHQGDCKERVSACVHDAPITFSSVLTCGRRLPPHPSCEPSAPPDFRGAPCVWVLLAPSDQANRETTTTSAAGCIPIHPHRRPAVTPL